MLFLPTTSTVLRIVTSTAANLDVHASWVDRLAGTDTSNYTDTTIAAAATTTVVAAPAASTVRNVRLLTIANRHATLSCVIQVQHYDGTAYQMQQATLKPGETLSYNDTAGWIKNDASGGRVETPLTGRYLGTSVLTAASGNFTTGPETNSICVRGVGAGAGGGGNTSVASAAAACGGGGAGGYVEKTFAVTPNTAYAYVCGALGIGNSAAAGSNGADSTFIVGATTVTAKGGTGGPQKVAANALTVAIGGAGGTVSTSGDLNSAGQPGDYGTVLIQATPIGCSGNGGSGPFGAGGIGLVAVGNGNNGVGFGSGGSGSFRGASAAGTGGSGTNGCWIVDEYS